MFKRKQVKTETRVNVELPPTMAERINRFIEIENKLGGPYGIGVEVIEIGKNYVTLQVSVVNAKGEALWKATEQTNVSVGGALHFNDLAKAFVFSTSYTRF